PDYVALSYCWGDPSITHPIIVNDLPVQVTTNLEAALRALRHQKVETVWIDALCINQLDLLEQGLQIMRMGLIYSNASYVI
ncbi:heterokaryon incompatibility, partial [Hyaloscypha hepaticicola]